MTRPSLTALAVDGSPEAARARLEGQARLALTAVHGRPATDAEVDALLSAARAVSESTTERMEHALARLVSGLLAAAPAPCTIGWPPCYCRACYPRTEPVGEASPSLRAPLPWESRQRVREACDIINAVGQFHEHMRDERDPKRQAQRSVAHLRSRRRGRR